MWNVLIFIRNWSVCEGVRRVRVSLMAQKADVDYVPETISADAVVQHIIDFGFGATLLESGVRSQHGCVDLQVCQVLKTFFT